MWTQNKCESATYVKENSSAKTLTRASSSSSLKDFVGAATKVKCCLKKFHPAEFKAEQRKE